jgi:hypothetical protein
MRVVPPVLEARHSPQGQLLVAWMTEGVGAERRRIGSAPQGPVEISRIMLPPALTSSQELPSLGLMIVHTNSFAAIVCARCFHFVQPRRSPIGRAVTCLPP